MKKPFKDLAVVEVLVKIYNRELTEASLNSMPKEKLTYFILELFNKGILNDYLLK